MNKHCPNGLQVRKNGHVVACKSACLVFNSPEHCCTGAYGSPEREREREREQIKHDMGVNYGT